MIPNYGKQNGVRALALPQIVKFKKDQASLPAIGNMQVLLHNLLWTTYSPRNYSFSNFF